MTGYLGIVSRSRPQTLLRCVTNALTLAGDSLLVGLCFDDDMTSYTQFPAIPGVSKLLLRPRHYYVRGTNAAYRFVKEIGDKAGLPCDYVVILNDDVEFLEYGWFPAAVQYLHERFPDGMGVVELGEVDKCANFITRAAFIDEFLGGEIGNPAYTMYCSDSELLCRLKAVDRYAAAALHDGRAVMRHATVQDALRDEVRSWYVTDREQFNKRAKEFGWTTL